MSVVFGCALGASTAASAQPRLGLHLDGAAGVFVPDPPASRGDLGLTVDGGARVGVRLIEGLSLQLGGGYRRYLSSTQSDASAVTVTAGLRGQLRAGRVGRAFVDAHAGAAFSLDTPDPRFTFDVGVGFEFALGSRVTLGPVVRYAHTLAWDGADDARALTAGLSLGFDLVPVTVSTAAPTYSDADGDGIVDVDDQCIGVPLGETPDPAHLGCPQADSDHDGLVDALDACPEIPGVHGCPSEADVHDRDHDGVPDDEDQCPDAAGAPTVETSNRGCPAHVVLAESQVTEVPRVLFVAGSDAISPEATPSLRAVVDLLRTTDLTLRVVGRVNPRTPEAPARRLARRRAVRVCGALVDAGVAPERLANLAWGIINPLALDAGNDCVSFQLLPPRGRPVPPGPTPSPASPQRPPVRRAHCPVRVVEARDPVRGAFDASVPSDRDHDGVVDDADRCPAEPIGAHPDRDCTGCPLRDVDGDGVLQDADRCPDEAAGAHPDPSATGCPDRDADGDGVLDHDDVCPTFAQGTHPDPERRGCPDGDADHDGVIDHADQCRTTPPGPHPDATRPGCPVPDGDHDGVPDRDDRCADRAGAPDTNLTRRGCADALTYDAVTGQVRLVRPVTFVAVAEAALPAGLPSLEAIVRAVRALGPSTRLRMEAPANDTALATRRAAWLTEWFVAHGLDESQVLVYPHGIGDAIASCTVVETER